MEDIIKSSRFLYIVFSNGLYIAEVNKMHSAKGYTINIRGEGETIEEAIESLKTKLDQFKADVL